MARPRGSCAQGWPTARLGSAFDPSVTDNRPGRGSASRARQRRRARRTWAIRVDFSHRTRTHRASSSLYKPLTLAAEAAKTDVRVTPQVLRRTFNTLMTHAGVDRIVLRSQMGHSSEEMTRRYAGVDIEDKHAAVAILIRASGHEG